MVQKLDSFSNETLDDYPNSQLKSVELFNLFSERFNAIFVSVQNYLVNTVEHLVLGILLYVTICIILFYVITQWKFIKFSRDMRNSKRLLFVIAHPDDEVMFFGPTIFHYIKKDCIVFLMCLSTGKNYGMGKVRRNELYRSCKVLGIKQENIFIYNHTSLPDSIEAKWPLEVISNQVLYLVDALNITNLITFDKYGISVHQNHCCIYYAIANLILDRQLPKFCGVFVLETVNILRKYSLFLDIPFSMLSSRFMYMHGFKQRSVMHKAMKKHKSQLVWFRTLYMIFSRYMLVNTLQQVNLVDIELDLELDD